MLTFGLLIAALARARNAPERSLEPCLWYHPRTAPHALRGQLLLQSHPRLPNGNPGSGACHVTNTRTRPAFTLDDHFAERFVGHSDELLMIRGGFTFSEGQSNHTSKLIASEGFG